MSRFVKLIPVLLVVPALWAHPHFMRKSSLGIGQGQEFTVQHITVPYNEANPDRLKVGAQWTAPSSKFTAPIDLVSGGNDIPAGEYKIALKRTGEKDFSMVLVQGEKNIPLATTFTGGLALQDHLLIDLRPTGSTGYLDLRFGPFLVSGSFDPKPAQ